MQTMNGMAKKIASIKMQRTANIKEQIVKFINVGAFCLYFVHTQSVQEKRNTK